MLISDSKINTVYILINFFGTTQNILLNIVYRYHLTKLILKFFIQKKEKVGQTNFSIIF
jgi:hypothetical protein